MDHRQCSIMASPLSNEGIYANGQARQSGISEKEYPNREIEADKGTERKGLLGTTRRKQGNGIDS